MSSCLYFNFKQLENVHFCVFSFSGETKNFKKCAELGIDKFYKQDSGDTFLCYDLCIQKKVLYIIVWKTPNICFVICKQLHQICLRNFQEINPVNNYKYRETKRKEFLTKFIKAVHICKRTASRGICVMVMVVRFPSNFLWDTLRICYFISMILQMYLLKNKKKNIYYMLHARYSHYIL